MELFYFKWWAQSEKHLKKTIKTSTIKMLVEVAKMLRLIKICGPKLFTYITEWMLIMCAHFGLVSNNSTIQTRILSLVRWIDVVTRLFRFIAAIFSFICSWCEWALGKHVIAFALFRLDSSFCYVTFVYILIRQFQRIFFCSNCYQFFLLVQFPSTIRMWMMFDCKFFLLSIN